MTCTVIGWLAFSAGAIVGGWLIYSECQAVYQAEKDAERQEKAQRDLQMWEAVKQHIAAERRLSDAVERQRASLPPKLRSQVFARNN